MRYFGIVIISVFLFSDLFAQSTDTDWPMFRGTADLSGNFNSDLPDLPQLLWSISTGIRTKSSPVVSDGTIFFGNDKGTLIAVSNDGIIKFRYEAGSAIDAAPMIYGRKVIMGTTEGILSAIDKVTGVLLWSYKTENQIAGSANVWVAGKRKGIVVGSYDYFLHCVDPETGQSLWKVETENYINGTPAILNGKVVFGGCDGMIRIVDPLTGHQKDTINIGVYIAASPALSHNMAFFGDYDGTKYCLDLASKKIIWKIQGSEESGAILAIPAVRNNVMIVGSEDKNLYCYNVPDGKLIWKFRTNGHITGSAIITSDKVLFTGVDGNVYILRLTDGKKLWSFNTGTPVSSSPAVIKGVFYILTEDGRLLAFGNKTDLKK